MDAAQSPTTPVHDRTQDLFTAAVEAQKSPIVHPLDRLRRTRSLQHHKRLKAPSSYPHTLTLDTNVRSCSSELYGGSVSATSMQSDWDLIFSPNSAPSTTTPIDQTWHLFPNLMNNGAVQVEQPNVVHLEVVAAEGMIAPFEDLLCVLKIGEDMIVGGTAICFHENDRYRVDWNQECNIQTKGTENLEISVHSETLATCLASGQIAWKSVPMPYAGWLHLDDSVRIYLRIAAASDYMVGISHAANTTAASRFEPYTLDCDVPASPLVPRTSSGEAWATETMSLNGSRAYTPNATVPAMSNLDSSQSCLDSPLYWYT